MKEQIEQAVRTSLAKYGLKANSLARIANMVETNITAMGAVDNLDGVIQSQIKALEPMMGVFQSEIDSYRQIPVPSPTSNIQPVPSTPASSPELEELKRLVTEQSSFIESLKQQQQQQAQKASRESITKSLKTAMFPEGVFDQNAFDATCYERADKFVEGADLEALKTSALENYNKRMSATNPNMLFMPQISNPGTSGGNDEAKKSVMDRIDGLIKEARV